MTFSFKLKLWYLLLAVENLFQLFYQNCQSLEFSRLDENHDFLDFCINKTSNPSSSPSEVKKCILHSMVSLE